MADLLGKASLWLEHQRHTHLAQAVVYQRGETVVEVQATIGKTIFHVDQGMGVLERIESRDYLLRAEDLIVEGNVTLPQAGDRIREIQGQTVFIYEVMSPGREPDWRYSDPQRTTLRIHTKQIGTEAF